MWNLKCPYLLCLFSAIGERRLEVCGHGHWQDFPLDVCNGVYTGISGTLSPSVAGWNDLDSNTWQEDTLFYLVKKTVYCSSFYFSKDLQVTLFGLAPGYRKVTHGETRWNISHWFHWAYKFFMRAKGQQRKYPSTPLHFDIELYSSRCHLH